MSILSKLFGGSGGGPAGPEPTEYQGFQITPDPMKEGSKFRISASISKEVAGETKTHKLIRADVLDSWDDAVDASVRKAKQMIDEQGDRLFR